MFARNVPTVVVLWGWLSLCLAVPSWAADDNEPVELLVGAAQRDITPALGFPLAGYYHERLATGTLDPLYAKALVLRKGQHQVALVACDLTGIATDLTREVRRRACAVTGIPDAHIVLSATHSHTAPDYSKDLYEYLAEPESPENRERYAHHLVEAIVEAIVEAQKRLEPGLVEVGVARQQTPIAFNRRFVMRDGSVRTWMNFENPEVVRAAGPTDPQVTVLLFRGKDDQQPLAVYSNFALHLDTVGGTRWSADYPFYVQRSIEDQQGTAVVSLFGLGCCGDINHSDPDRRERNKTDFIGQALAQTVQAALKDAQPIENPGLEIRSTSVSLPLRSVSEEQLRRAAALLEAAKQGTEVEFFDLVSAYRDVILEQLRSRSPRVEPTGVIGWGLSRALAGGGENLQVEVTTISLGQDAAIVFLPGEVFVDLGLAIKQSSPFRHTLVVELANAVETAYVPTRAAYAQGSYEVTNSTLEAGAGEMLVESALRLLREAAAASGGGTRGREAGS